MTIQMRSHLLIGEDVPTWRVLVIGAGSVGSNVAMGLASIGVRNFTIYDHDTVGIHNLPSQYFTSAQVGYGKAEMLAENLHARYDATADMRTWPKPEKFSPSTPGKGDFDIIISAADSMTVRKMVAMWARGQNVRIVDTRCAGHEIQTWAFDSADPKQMEQYMSTLHSDAEASPLPCGGEMYPSAGLAATLNTLAALNAEGWFYRLADTELSIVA